LRANKCLKLGISEIIKSLMLIKKGNLPYDGNTRDWRSAIKISYMLFSTTKKAESQLARGRRFSLPK
jgi:hypothetical protein